MRNFNGWFQGGRGNRRKQDNSFSRRRPGRLALKLESLEDRAMMTAAVTPVYAVTNSWNTGFQADLRLDSHQTANVATWQLEFDLAANITSIWNAKIAAHTGSHYTVVGESWDASLPAGSSVDFGFVASGNSQTPPANYLFNGAALGGSTPALPTLSIGDVTQNEGQSGKTAYVFNVVLSAPSTTATTVKYATADGTALAGSDYTATSGTLTFAPGQISQAITVFVLGDTQFETDEAFYVDLSGRAGATVSRARGTGTIKNDDAAPAQSGNVQFQVTSDWGSGFTAQVTLRNTGAAAINNWRLEFDYAGTITSIWDAAITSHTGNHYVIDNAGYDATIAGGGTLAFGFNGSPGNVTTGPANYVLSDLSPGGTTAGSGRSGGGSTSGGSSGSSTGGGAGIVAAVGNWPAHVCAPYVDMTLYPMYDLVSAAQAQGLRYFNLAFVVADPAGKPAWGGYAEYELGTSFDTQLKTQISGLRALGGDVAVSFGGASGQELAQVITDPAALARAYQTVIDDYGLTHIDFDVEGAAVADHASIDRRNQAIAILQANAAAAGKTLSVSYTLPVLPTGLTADGLYVVQSAVRYGVNLGLVNVMAMDYGDSAAPSPSGQMGTYAIDSANSVFSQLKTIYGTSSDTQLWGMVGVTPMIGLNDNTSEVFDQAAARQLLTFAQQKGLGEIGIWSLNRDQQNSAGAINWVDIKSSSILEQPFEFSQIFKPFTA